MTWNIFLDDYGLIQLVKADLSVAVSSAILLAFCVGVVQLVVYSSLAGPIIRSMGVKQTSGMWHSAVSYLFVRALGTPAATLWLVTNGIFRGGCIQIYMDIF